MTLLLVASSVTRASTDGLVTVALRDTPLPQALTSVAYAVGARLEAPRLPDDVRVSASLERASVEEALRQVLRGGSYLLRYDSTGRLTTIEVLSVAMIRASVVGERSASPADSRPDVGAIGVLGDERSNPARTRANTTAREFEITFHGSPSPVHGVRPQTPREIRRDQAKRLSAAEFAPETEVMAAILVEGSVDEIVDDALPVSQEGEVDGSGDDTADDELESPADSSEAAS